MVDLANCRNQFFFAPVRIPGVTSCSSQGSSIIYPDIDRVYAAMRRGRNIPTSELAGRRLCLPFAACSLFPDNEVCQSLLASANGPYSINSLSIPGGLCFSIPGGESQCSSPGKYVVVLKRDHFWHCVGVSVEDSGLCTWYDSERPCEYICDVGELPDMEDWDVSSVTVSDERSLHMLPSSDRLLGGGRRCHVAKDERGGSNPPKEDAPIGCKARTRRQKVERSRSRSETPMEIDMDAGDRKSNASESKSGNLLRAASRNTVGSVVDTSASSLADTSASCSPLHSEGSGDTSVGDAGGEGAPSYVKRAGLKEYIQTEVAEAISEAQTSHVRGTGGDRVCRLCPTRKFAKKHRLMEHIAAVRNVGNRSGSASSKVLQLAKALFNRDQVLRGDGLLLGRSRERGAYLERACEIIAKWMDDGGAYFDRFRQGRVAQIDRHIRLCLTKGGLYTV